MFFFFQLQQRFTQHDPLHGAPELSLKELSEDSEFGLCSYDLMLPDSATIYGRLFLGAWDAGLDNVADDTVNLMLHATEVKLAITDRTNLLKIESFNS